MEPGTAEKRDTGQDDIFYCEGCGNYFTAILKKGGGENKPEKFHCPFCNKEYSAMVSMKPVVKKMD